MAIDTTELLGLKMEPSQDSFTFVDNSKANSASIIKNVKVEIGECIIPVDFHVVEIKSGKTSSRLFGRAFMATMGAVCDLKRNKMCLTNVDERVFYDHVEKKKSEEFISCIETCLKIHHIHLIQIASLQNQLHHRSTFSLQHRSTGYLENRSTFNHPHRLTPSKFHNRPRLKSLSLGEGVGRGRSKRRRI
ncbi:hypothetical protein F2Q70_00004306 [Brassica cretica]|uniref:Uncharacterized protein n=1 Tax=Brassica cretica TaxID=69181 RepID=A0A8S9IUN2_BRACR|nr:hypothetical protein F2Q70_00004306 [Brassica cretica]